MLQSKIIQILTSFTEKEWRACHKFLKYCNKKESNALNVFEYLFKYRNRLESPKLRRSFVIRKLFPGLNEKTFFSILSHLTKDVESFLVQQEIDHAHRSFDKKKLLAEVYKERGLYKCFDRTLNELFKEVERSPQLDPFTNLRHMHVHHLNFYSDSYNKTSRPFDSLRQAELNRLEFAENLQKLYEISFFNSKSLLNLDVNWPRESRHSELSELLRHIKKLVNDHDVESEQYLERLLQEQVDSMSSDMAEMVLLHLTNECIYQIRKSNHHYERKMANLYILGLEKGILLNSGRLSEKRFLNIIDILSKTETDIVPSQFIGKWIELVETQHRVSLENMAYAIWAFANEDYNSVLYYVESSDITFINLNISLRARWMKICSLSSLYKEYQESREVLESSRLFFKRHRKEMNETTFKASMKLLNVINMIWSNKSRTETYDFVQDCEFIVQRNWIDKQLIKMA